MLIQKNSLHEQTPVYTLPIPSKPSDFSLWEKIKAIFERIKAFFEIKTTKNEESKKEASTLFKVLISMPLIQLIFMKIVNIASDLFSEKYPTKLDMKLMLEEETKINRQKLLELQAIAFELDSFVLNHPDLKKICEEHYVDPSEHGFHTKPLNKKLCEWSQVRCQIIYEKHNIKTRIRFAIGEPAIYDWLVKYEGSDMPDFLKYCLTSSYYV